jgi:signal peptidase I
LLSALLPGAGHLLVHRRFKGLLLFLTFVLMFVLFWWLRLPRTIVGIIAPIPLLIGLCVLATWDAAYASTRTDSKPTQWWLAILLPTALFAGAIHFNWQLRVSGFNVYSIPSTSMSPTIPFNSRAMVDRWRYHDNTPQPGDIIVFVPPSDSSIVIVKRVIAVAGQTIEVDRDRVLVDGHHISEPYAVFKGVLPAELSKVAPIKLAQDKIFVMGDNRHISFDSRMFGPVDVSAVRGKLIYVVPSLFKGDAKTLE